MYCEISGVWNNVDGTPLASVIITATPTFGVVSDGAGGAVSPSIKTFETNGSGSATVTLFAGTYVFTFTPLVQGEIRGFHGTVPSQATCAPSDLFDITPATGLPAVRAAVLAAEQSATDAENFSDAAATFAAQAAVSCGDPTAILSQLVQKNGDTMTGNLTITSDGLTVKDADGATIRIESSDTSVDGGSLGAIEFYSNDASAGGTGVKGKIETIDETGFGVNYKIDISAGVVSGGVNTIRKQMTMYNNDISFYEGTGTTPKFFWDASSESLGIGTSSPSNPLDVNADSIRVRTAQTPATASAAGNQGEIAWDADYIYVCTATNTWKRASLTTW